MNQKRNDLVIEHLSLARAMAAKFFKRHKLPGLELEDFVSAAMLGLCEAAKKYDFESGNKFSSYAFYRIRGAMFDIMRSSATLPRTVYCEIKKGDEHSKFNFRTAKDISELISLQSVIEDYGICMHFGAKSHVELTYSRSTNPEKEYETKEAKSYLNDLVENLSEDRKTVVNEYYFNENTYKQIESKIGGKSKSWISRLRKSALGSLRNSIESSQMRMELETSLAAS